MLELRQCVGRGEADRVERDAERVRTVLDQLERNGRVKWRANANVSWRMGGWSAGWFASYFGSFVDTGAETTAQIYKGSIAFIILQLIMVSVVIAYPKLVIGNIEAAAKVDDATVTDMLNNMPGLEQEEEQDPTQGMEGAEQPAEPAPTMM